MSSAVTHAISNIWIFLGAGLSLISSLPQRTPHTVCAVVDIKFNVAHSLALSTPSILLLNQAPRFSKFTQGWLNPSTGKNRYARSISKRITNVKIS